jgi:hypothetical protein
MAKAFGITGVALVVTAASFIRFSVESIILVRLLSIKMNQVLLNVRAAIFAALAMACVLLICARIFSFSRIAIPCNAAIIVSALIAITLYGVIVLRVEKTLSKEIHTFFP